MKRNVPYLLIKTNYVGKNVVDRIEPGHYARLYLRFE